MIWVLINLVARQIKQLDHMFFVIHNENPNSIVSQQKIVNESKVNWRIICKRSASNRLLCVGDFVRQVRIEPTVG